MWTTTYITTIHSDTTYPTNAVVGPVWFRIKDDGTTNRLYQVSYDGVIFNTLFTEARTTFFTSPDSCGYALNIYAGSTTVTAGFISFIATTP